MVSLIHRVTKLAPVGLDVGSTGARAVQLLRKKDAYTLLHMSRHDWPALPRGPVDGAAAEPPCGQHTPATAARIRRCVPVGRFHGCRIVTAVNPPDVEFHTLDLPDAVLNDPTSDLPEIVRWELERLTTLPIGDLETRHWRVPAGQGRTSTAIGVTVPRKTILATLDACDGAGLFCECVDVGAAALARMGSLLAPWSADVVWGVLDIGFHAAQLILCVDGVAVLVRTAGVGGHAWTQRIADALHVSYKAAEIQKRDHGIAPIDRTARRVDSRAHSPVADMIHGALRTELRLLAAEVKRSYEYVLGCYPGRRAGDLVLVGGGAALANLPGFLSDALAIPVRRPVDYLSEPACRLQVPSAWHDALTSLALAVGLTLSGRRPA